MKGNRSAPGERVRQFESPGGSNAKPSHRDAENGSPNHPDGKRPGHTDREHATKDKVYSNDKKLSERGKEDRKALESRDVPLDRQQTNNTPKESDRPINRTASPDEALAGLKEKLKRAENEITSLTGMKANLQTQQTQLGERIRAAEGMLKSVKEMQTHGVSDWISKLKQTQDQKAHLALAERS